MSGRALVTGAAGFVGRTLSSYLAGKGWTVSGCDLDVPADADVLHACDVTDLKSVSAMAEWAGDVTHVFHLAGLAFAPDAKRDPAAAFRVNLEGTINVAEAVRTRWPNARIVFAGSAEAYGPPQSLPITEDHPLDPQHPYAISKAAADLYCGFLHREHGVDVVRLRPFNHSGPGQAPVYVLSAFARQFAQIERGEQEPVLRVGNLDSLRDFSHVSDIVVAYELAAIEGESGEAYNLCSGVSHAIRDIVEILTKLTKIEVKVEQDPNRIRPNEIKEVRGSNQKFHARTGWSPAKSLEDILGDLLEHWREN